MIVDLKFFSQPNCESVLNSDGVIDNPATNEWISLQLLEINSWMLTTLCLMIDEDEDKYIIGDDLSIYEELKIKAGSNLVCKTFEIPYNFAIKIKQREWFGVSQYNISHIP